MVERYKDDKVRGLIEMQELMRESLGRDLTEQEAKLVKSIYDFSFEHGVRTGTSILTEAFNENTGKDDHES